MSVTEPEVASAPAREALGTIEGIYVAATAGAPMKALDEARAIAGRGLEGDRYFERVGTYSDKPGSGRHLTMIDAAELETLAAEQGIELRPNRSRRNLVIRGADLPALIGRRVWVGEALCEVPRECAPCAYLEALTQQPGLLNALVGRGGIRLEVLRDGLIRRGDPIRLAE
jgi:MOSC domain-containing protein YiiM